MEKSIKKLCYLALFCAIAIVLSYVESLIPLYLGAPGAKLGLANVVTLTLLLCFGLKEAFIVMFLRILIVSMTFTNFYMFLYSLSGGLLSLIIMYLFLKTNLFSDIIISIMGGIFHNVGQLLVAMLFFSSTVFMYYLPYFTGRRPGLLNSRNAGYRLLSAPELFPLRRNHPFRVCA